MTRLKSTTLGIDYASTLLTHECSDFSKPGPLIQARTRFAVSSPSSLLAFRQRYERVAPFKAAQYFVSRCARTVRAYRREFASANIIRGHQVKNAGSTKAEQIKASSGTHILHATPHFAYAARLYLIRKV